MADCTGGQPPTSVGIELPKITPLIANILKRYPDGGQILKELIQNADDAGASEVKFMLDKRSYPCSGEELLTPKLVDFQGPALYAWNDAVFSNEDWDHIGLMYNSSKEKQPMKVGRFGLGFMSVFHMTDLPVIVSGHMVGILDPHNNYTDYFGSKQKAGLGESLSKFMKCPGHAACFAGIFDLDVSQDYYHGSLFRFPLRREGANSEISKFSYPPERVLETLYESFFEEAPIILLFLKHVQKISLYEGKELLYKVAIDPSQREVVTSEKSAFNKCASKPIKCVLRAYSMTVQVNVHRRDTSKAYHWLIMNLIGHSDEQSKKLGFLPWVGIAAPLPGTIHFSGLNIETDDINGIMQALKTPKIENQLSSMRSDLAWTGKVEGHSEGHVFCFLPLPGKTVLPVNVHGYFAVADNRRTILWPSHDDQSGPSLWNEYLVKKLIAPAYSVLLTVRSSLLSYNGTPLPLPFTEGCVTDPYAAWPLYSEVKNDKIWKELLKPALNRVCSERILWTAAEKGKWVTPTEAVFLPAPSSSATSLSAIPEVAIKVLIEAGVPVVSLPVKVRETLQHSQELLNVVTPARVRATLHDSLVEDIAADRNSTHQLLEYILSDVHQCENTNHELDGVKLLPLATGICTAFSNNSDTDIVYVLQTKEHINSVLECLPGMEKRFVDPTLPPSLLTKLHHLAGNKCLQLRFGTPQNILEHLLPLSLSSWSTYNCHGDNITWMPEMSDHMHPPFSWLKTLWNRLCEPFLLKGFEGLPIIPVEEICQKNAKRITLVPLPVSDSSDSAYFINDNRTSVILGKLGATVVHKNRFVFNHPDIENYISEINISTILSFLRTRQAQVCDLLDGEKSALRREIARSCDTDRDTVVNFRDLIVKLPIFEVGVGATEPGLMALHDPNESNPVPVLPPKGLQFPSAVQFPHNILSGKELNLLQTLDIEELSINSLCCKHLIPFALSQCKQSRQWCNGDEIFKWILSMVTNTEVFGLEDISFIRTSTDPSVLVKPCQLYSYEEQFKKLFNEEKDQVFAGTEYREKVVVDKLKLCGLQTWKELTKCHEKLSKLLKERAISVNNERMLSTDSAHQRSLFVLEVAANHQKSYLILEHLKKIPFLVPQSSCPDFFPAGLIWFGTCNEKLYSLTDVCVPNERKSAYLVGSVRPILQNNYVVTESVARYSYEPTAQDVIAQLTMLAEIENIHHGGNITAMVQQIYDFLSVSEFLPEDLPPNWIWCSTAESFNPASRFAIQTPISLNPFVFSISSDQILNRYKDLFCKMGIQDTLPDSVMVEVLLELSKASKLSQHEIDMVQSILTHLHGKKYENKDEVFMLTVGQTLKLAKECVFVDRGRVRERVANTKHHFIFVHDSIPANVAQYFGVDCLSRMVAPSRKVAIDYKAAGQNESITRRIKGIVKDYSGNIDIFKELIQNADDAKATQVKFVIDWREHSRDNLLVEELGCWQGPALLAYNNAVFSDEDLANICQLAAETKLKDPLKTGRFGLGFCSTYYLTDVPSFVSRRYFTMFDPHTWYLKERVSHNQPGITIDLVDTQEDLQVYEDQFIPFNGLFGCNIFKLEEDGFQGTIFRFPFRTRDCESSEICRKCHSNKDINNLVHDFQDEASNLLLFLKNVEQVEVFVLEQTATLPSEMKKLFSVTKQSNNADARLNMIQNHSSHPQPICSSCVIEYDLDSKQSYSSHHYLVASALSQAACKTMNQPGMIPLAEIAVEVIEKDQLLIPKPVEKALFFCFLPLPFKSHLPFHVNGFFDIGNDRCNLSEALDSNGSQWNSALVEEAVPLALECLIAHLAQKCNLFRIENEDERHTELISYYSFWPGIDGRDETTTKKRRLMNVIEKSSKDHLAISNRSILWCDIKGGKWITPGDAYLFVSELPKEVMKQVIVFLLENGYAVLPTATPLAIRNILIHRVSQVITYESFFKEVFLPRICISEDTCHYQLMFALQSYQNLPSEFVWVKEALVSTKCIPVQSTKQLVRPDQLVDPRQHNIHVAALYSPEEGRFPTETFKANNQAMESLVEFGMISKSLRISQLVERAKTVGVLADGKTSVEKATTRMEAIFDYLIAVESATSGRTSATDSAREERITALWEIRFLKSEPCPTDVSLPWCSVDQFVSPSQVFSSKYSALVFSQKPVVEFSEEQSRLVHYLGISRNEPLLEVVLKHTCKLISFLEQNDDVDKSTLDYLDEVFGCIYSYLAKHCGERQDLIKQSLGGQKWIWQDGHLLSSKQVLKEWKHNFYPYLCQLSITKSNKSSKMESLYQLLGVQHEATVECLLAILEQVKSDFHDNPLSSEAQKFVIHVLGLLSDKVQKANNNVLLVTAEGTLKPANECTFDDREWIKQKATTASRRFTFIHDKIPASQARKLGVRPLSHKIAPSKKLAINYKTTGPQESITRRINGIVKDYSGDLDIFKELVQNADDAKATQVTFVIDWREHSKENLIAGELGCWQGPALLAYNNAVFSDKDLVNICKLAAETKLKDPMKTGRFGLGFCSTYYLTDVPSFVSQRYFTMFDPHTWYLKDRVSPNQPGITIDLIETQEDLQVYEDQFIPFNGLFGCNIFKLEEDGFQGTIFRFPFRTRDCESSEICKKCHSSNDIDDLVRRFQNEASNILLFLKNVEQLEVFVLEETATLPSDMKKIFSVTKRSNNTDTRLNMIQNHSSHPQPMCSSCVIEHEVDSEHSHSSHHYLVASALSPATPMAMNQPGMIPLAEIAVEVMEKDQLLIPKPVENALFFCFLPLPFKSHLPFHVNGFFDVGKDRRNLTEALDSNGSKWNSALVEGAVPLALECLIAHLAENFSNLHMMKVEKERHNALMSYYTLWLGDDCEEATKRKWLTNMIVDFSRKYLSKSERNILWSDINGGKWVSPRDAYLFDSELPEEVEKQVIYQLLEKDYAVLPLLTPPRIRDALRMQLSERDRIFTYERFFKEIFLFIPSIAAATRNNQLMFALRSYQDKRATSRFDWVKDILTCTECIPTQCTDMLVRPAQLIDPRQNYIASLYRPEEGRFPNQEFTKDDSVMSSLVEFGMVSDCLPIPELVERAETVSVLAATDHNGENQLMEAIFRYLLKIEPSSHFNLSTKELAARQQRITALWEIAFLKAKPCPADVSLPWCSVEQFVSPSQVFSSEYSPLLFSQKPVVELSERLTGLIEFLGISRNKPLLEVVLKHTCKLISFLEQNDDVDKSTLDYLDEVFGCIYSYLAKHCVERQDLIKQSLEGQKWIWQDGHLLSSKQVLIEWKHNFYPYLCQLSITKSNKSSEMESLYQLLGVQHEATMECLLAILEQVKSDFHDNPLSSEAQEFVIHVIGVLSTKLKKPEKRLLMITADRKLKPAIKCVFDDREWVKRKATSSHRFTLIHESISASQAKQFYIEPLSQRIAPSRKLNIKHKAAGPNESITRRIKGIVKDYSGNIDIFKELIQNADDAKATQVKFVIDWREHSKENLLAKELKCWQGPALLAYNNAVFSDEDLENICQLAAETKMKDPLKTGQFGLGFCSTYYLTDVPSFVSRRCFTMFDPHTWYLKERVSPNQPGITIDLVDTQEDLQVYEDQFIPFNGLFGCNIFKLEEDGFQGTIFRFPFRTRDCESSEICMKCHSKEDINNLVHDLQNEASNILLFLKNVEQVEVFILEQTATLPSEMKTFFSVTKLSNNADTRLNMIQNHSSHPQPICSSCVIEHEDSKQSHSSHHYLIASALSPLMTLNRPGMIPLAEIAVEVMEKDQLLVPKPVENALLFCFLPLPFKSHLPFHVNGFFDVGKDRRNLTEALDSNGSKWNSALVEGAVPLALECLIAHLAQKCNLNVLNSKEKRDGVLLNFYSLWHGGGSSKDFEPAKWLANVILKSSKSNLANCDKNILWCDINGGKWVSPCDAYLLDSETLPVDIANQVVDLLLEMNIPILPISTPLPIRCILNERFNHLRLIFTYERFFKETLIPNLHSISPSVCSSHVMFALSSYQSKPSEYVWVEEVLVSTKCIPTQCTELLVTPSELIDPRIPHIASLYSPEESRFPNPTFAGEDSVMKSLVEFGMVNETLPIPELVDRAETVAVLAAEDADEKACTRMEKILNYLLKIESLKSSSNTDRKARIEALWRIRFLKSEPCPADVSLPWFSAEQFVSPSQVFSSKYSALVFSQKPVVNFSEEQYRLVHYLGIDGNTPRLELVLKHLQELILYLQQNNKVTRSTSDYLDKVFESIYLAMQRGGNLAQIKRSLEGQKWIWQDGNLHTSEQILREWKYSFYPYLCQLSATKSSQIELFQYMGVQKEATSELLLKIIEQVKNDYCENSLSDEATDFVIHVLQELCNKMQTVKDVLVVTTDKQLKPACKCVYDDREWIRRKTTTNIVRRFPFIHDKFSASQAQKLDVKPLSQRIAPSRKLDIKYKAAGPHESITWRIKGIVKDYSGNIDIFKELIQNADDAKATQVKFVIDWREHSRDNLLVEELGCWQGPALLAYNNSVFSNEDLENICQLAAETKLKDPLKTGRFGLGFCSTYYLTDVPSFVSRRCFTMFDPHTCYLKDRVSHNQPGIKIDLVDTQEDLQVYEDQFIPFNGLFGCNIFKLEEDGFQGTIFRFPFRTRECHSSEICMKCHSNKDIDDLVHDLQNEASNILLFLKNVEQVEVFILEQTATLPSEMKKLFSVTKRSNNANARLNMIQNHSSHPQPICSSCVIEHEVDSKQSYSNHHYLVASALSPLMTVNEPGMIPLAEIAVEVIEKDQLLIPKPMGNALFFCFLPLPIETYLPFHVNGFFDIGKDRRNLTEALDSEGSKWNSSVVEKAVPLAMECLIAHIAKNCNLCMIDNEKERHDILCHYYSLWLGNNSREETIKRRWLANVIIESSKSLLAESKRNILWCDINGGEWVSPCDAYLLVTKLPDEVAEQVIILLLKMKYPILPLSTRYSIRAILKKQLSALQHTFTYERFFNEIFIPNIREQTAAVCNNQMMFTLTSYQENSSEFNWVKEIVMSTECIPTQCTEMLVRPAQLIDPRTVHIASLYVPDEGRFPSEIFAENDSVMKSLVEFGMISKNLPVPQLVERAQTVTLLADTSIEAAYARMKNILHYLIEVEPRTSYRYLRHNLGSSSDRKARIEALWEIRFLKPEPCPAELSLPWCSVEHFVSPSQVFSSKYSPLLFSQKPVVEFFEGQTNLVEYLGISENTPTLIVVLDHATALIKFVLRCESVKKESASYLDEVFHSIYTYLAERKGPSEEEQIKMHFSDLKCIWQNGHLLSSSQVVRHWEYKPSMYLCELSQRNKAEKFERLFQLLGVRNEVTVDHLLHIMRQIKDEYGEKPLPTKNLMEFVVAVIKVLHNKISHADKEQYKGVVFLLPDEAGVLRQASQITCDSSLQGEWKWIQDLPLFVKFQEEGGRFLHPDIPRKHSLTLGARPILDTLLKEIEDDSFLDGTDFGQEENLVDRLNSILNKYSDDPAIFKEFIQNADDAKASELVFVLDHRNSFPDKSLLKPNTQWKKLQNVPALCIFNNRPFSESDLQGICQLGRGGKSFSAETIGRFGIGFNVAYHVTDCPMFITYDSTGNPTDFCVFDPLCHYLPTSLRKNKPGRRWKITPEHISQFPDQFKPFLQDEFSKFRSLAPQCLKDLSKGYVVFRLPFVRKLSTSDNTRVLCDGIGMSPYVVKKRFSELQSTAKESLLFLSNLKSITYFEISHGGNCSHHFTSLVEDAGKLVNHTYQLTATYVETSKVFGGEYKTTHSQAEWLIHKKNGFKTDHGELLDKAGKEGLKPAGGVAALLDCSSQTGSLFCFLPMLSPSGVPVHLNAHFLVDDSRKHLTTVKGLEQWNPTIGSEILVPSYVELILSAREHVTGSQESIKWFYSLFPDLTPSFKTLDTLEVGIGIYKSLLQNNHAVLLDQRSIDRKERTLKWLCLNGYSNVGYFCKSSLHVYVDSELKDVLLSLGMPITCAPDYVFDSLCVVSQPYKKSMEGLITPDKVLAHLKVKKDKNEAVIKQYFEMLLKFCIQGSKDNELKPLLTGVPLLLSVAETLETSGSLFSQHFSSLLPHCQQCFANPRLDNPKSELYKRLSDANVICKLDVDFVAKNIQLPKMRDPMMLSPHQSQTVRRLWEYLTTTILWNPLMSDVLSEHFNTYPIIPTKDGFYYPPFMGKCVFKREPSSTNVVLSVVKKLGYAELDQATIGSTALRYTSDIFSSSTSPKDVISCLSLKSPSTYSVLLTSDEVNAFTSIVIQSTDIPRKVLDCLKKLPLFQTVDDSFISLSGTSVLIVPPRAPTAGLLALSKATGQVVLKAPESQREIFYTRVMDYQKSCYSASQFYLNFLLPNFGKLSDADLLEHLKYICTYAQDSDWQGVISTLKRTPLITVALPIKGRVLVSELYDPQNRFYATFLKDKLPPDRWCTAKWLPFLTQLGLRTTVTKQEWLTMARLSANEAENLENKEKCKKQCATLLATLSHMIDTDYCGESNFLKFLGEVSKIKFIYCPAPSQLESLIKTLTHHSVASSSYRMFTCFHGTVNAHSDDLAGLTRVVLPSSCDLVMQDRRILKPLGIDNQYSLETQVVVDNLLKLCDATKATAIISLNKETADAVKTLEAVFHKHYKFLEETLSISDKCIDALADKECVLLFPDRGTYTYILVKPSQLVQHIPSQYDFRPFVYGVPSEIRCFGKLLARLKVEEEMTPTHCIEILSDIKSEVDKNNSKLSEDQHYSSVCVHAFNALILGLRQQKSPLPKLKCYLPSEDLELMEASQLVYNDSPYIKSRLQKSPAGSSQYKFVMKPPPDENGQSTPPSCLGVKSLSSMAVETLHSNVNLRHNRCVQDELQQCQWVQALEDTFNSRDFSEGLERLYWHEHSKNPQAVPEFLTAVKSLYKCKIKCVHEIKTTIYVQNREIQGTEDTSKLCHFATQAGGTLLYITHNSPQFTSHLLLLQLATNIAKVVKHMLRNESHIMAILECSPQAIQSTLDLAQVAPYDSKAVDISSSTCLGNKFEGRLSNQDFLIICNFSPNELVLYQSASTDECKYARVVQSRYQPGCDVTDHCVELCTDMNNSRIRVSPLQVYKILGMSHKAALWKTGSSTARFTTSVALANVPHDDLASLKNWIKHVLKTPYLKDSFSLCRLSLRLVAHMHYMLVTCGTNPKIFNEGVQKLLRVIKRVSHAWSGNSAFKICADEVDKLVYQLTGTTSVSPKTTRASTSSTPAASISPKVRRQLPKISYQPTGHRQVVSHHPSSFPVLPSQATSMATPPQPAVSAAAPFGGTPSIPAASVRHQPPLSQAQAVGVSRFSQIPLNIPQVPTFPLSSHYNPPLHRWTPTSTPSCTPPVDVNKAKMWLEQAKADLLAALYLFKGSEQEKEVEEVEEEEEEEEDEDARTCRFPALVCFLTHDVVEKCLKGVLYAKCGLPSHLLSCVSVVELEEEMEKTSGVTKQFLQVAKECTMLVNEHVAKSRYPNYQVPPCAPAAVYTALQASEALAAATKLMKKAAQLEGIGDLVGNLDNLPQARLTTALSFMTAGQEVPPFWDEHSHDEEFKLVLLDPVQDEFHRISAYFLQSMPHCEIRRIDRIQNKLLWRKYCDRARQMYNYGQVLREESLFHGTDSHKPEEIYKGDASFDMRFCQKGMWGRGNYFAVNASYSNSGYAYKEGGVRQILMAYVLTGHSYQCHPDGNLTKPPFRPSQGAGSVQRRYDSVCGVTGGSKVYITYDNDRAYPAYLISYKCLP